MILAIAQLLLPLLMATTVLCNLFLLRRPKQTQLPITASVDVLIPLRNEAHNIPALISTLSGQARIEQLNFHLLDDNSSDNTYALAHSLLQSDSRFHLHTGKSLEQGWLGKPFAMQQLIQKSTADLLIFIDADVRLEPNALADSLDLLDRLKLDFISIYPRQVAYTWSERLIQPLLQWSWMSTLFLRKAERSSNPALAVANGQFFITRSAAITSIDGFAGLAQAVLDDIYLARALLRKGFHGCVADGSRLASCRMYESWPQLRDGYSKSLRVAFGNRVGSAMVMGILLVSSVFPLALAVTGNWWGWIGYILIVKSRALSAFATRARIRDSLLHPLSVLLLIYLIARSWNKRGKVLWKGRPV